MSIRFNCEHCGKEIKAPDDAGGRRGKCPFCKQSCYIPAPVSEEELLDVAPVDEAAEAAKRREQEALAQQERELIAEMRGEAGVPLEERDDLTPEDLYHFVVNYCLSMFNGKLEAAEDQVQQLSRFSNMGQDAVEDFLKGKTSEEALDAIPKPVLEAFLKTLKTDVAEAAKRQKKQQ